MHENSSINLSGHAHMTLDNAPDTPDDMDQLRQVFVGMGVEHQIDLSRLWYLATPYTKYQHGTRAAFKDAARVAGSLLAAGVNAFSPVVHSHALTTAAGGHLFLNSQDFWMDVHRPFLEAAHGLLLATLPGWEQSEGMKLEKDWFERAGKPIFVLPIPAAMIFDN